MIRFNLQMKTENLSTITSSLQTWFDTNKRQLSFRHRLDPYTIWVSEVMLQQTQVETMLPYFDRFMIRFPNVHLLAKATLEEVLTIVQGIGYYRRFRLMHQGAKYLVDNLKGIFPKTYEEVKAIPGVGDYTAGAILSIAYNLPYPATDGNVLRVLSRYYGIEEDIKKFSVKKTIETFNSEILKHGEPRTLTPALMELGALVCRPKQPSCDVCPLQSSCVAFKDNKTKTIPYVSEKKAIKHVELTTLFITDGERVVLHKNDASLLKDMYLLPQTEHSDFQSLLQLYQLDVISIVEKGLFKHTFSHQQWWMTAFLVKVKSLMHVSSHSLTQLDLIPIPEAHKKIVFQIKNTL